MDRQRTTCTAAFARSRLISSLTLASLLIGCDAPAPPAAPSASRETIQETRATVSTPALVGKIRDAFKIADAFTKKFSKLNTAFETALTILDFFDIAHFPSAESRAIAALAAALNQFEGDLIWYLNAIDTHDHLDEIMGDLTAMREQVEMSQSDPSVHFTTASNAFTNSAEHIGVLMDDLHFLRRFRQPSAEIRSIIPPSDLADAQPISIAEDPGGQWVYDWRYGLSTLVLGVVARVAILEAADPGIHLSTVRDELMNIYNTLLTHYNKMYAGVKCNYYDSVDPTAYRPPGVVDVLCADIYTGSFKELDLPHGNIDNDRDACRICNPPGSPPGCPTHWDPVTQSNVFSYDAQCMANVDANWAAYWNNVQTTLAELRREVLADIPLYELRSLMNALYSLANPAPDLTENQQRIAKKFWGDLCLDIQNGNLAPGAPVWMWPCTGSGNAAQRWHYDPATETIVNPTSSLCIDVQLDANTQRLEPVLATCNGADSQRWSYDPTQSVLYSGAGSTTVLRAGAAQGDFPYLDWKDETPGSGWPHFLDPFWLADAVNPCVEQSPLSRDVDSCVDQICGAQVDPYCCDNGWDDQCVDEVGSVCGQYCPPPL